MEKSRNYFKYSDVAPGREVESFPKGSVYKPNLVVHDASTNGIPSYKPVKILGSSVVMCDTELIPTDGDYCDVVCEDRTNISRMIESFDEYVQRLKFTREILKDYLVLRTYNDLSELSIPYIMLGGTCQNRFKIIDNLVQPFVNDEFRNAIASLSCTNVDVLTSLINEDALSKMARHMADELDIAYRMYLDPNIKYIFFQSEDNSNYLDTDNPAVYDIYCRTGELVKTKHQVNDVTEDVCVQVSMRVVDGDNIGLKKGETIYHNAVFKKENCYFPGI